LAQRIAIALMSGGLDSTLAAKLIKDQGVHVIGLHLSSPFGCHKDVEKNANAIGVPILIREKGEAYLDLVKNPQFGYGKNMNPCIDCRIFMFDLASIVMEEEQADFVVTGEVLGQRPMSQRREAMDIIDKHSTLRGLVLRPLSAGRLRPTLPEERGWVKREKFLEICGRGRGIQLELAKELGVTDFDAPGGGCLLTEAAFSNRLRDHYEHDDDDSSRLARSGLLRFGRHFRLSPKLKVILGRNHSENLELELRWMDAKGTFFDPKSFDGPNAVTLGDINESEREYVGEMILRYSRVNSGISQEVVFESLENSGVLKIHKGVSDEWLSTVRV
jgi:hypothetical protein